MLDLDLLSVSQMDIEVISQLRLDRIGEIDLQRDPHFSRCENVFKLISLLGIGRRYDQIQHIISNSPGNADISSNAQLEVILSCLYENVSFDYSTITGEVKTCINYFETKEIDKSNLTPPDQTIDLLCRLRTLQYLILDEKIDKADALISVLAPIEKLVVARYFGSWLIFITAKLREIRPFADFRPFLRLAQYLKNSLKGIPLDELNLLTLAIAQTQGKLKNFDRALKEVRSIGNPDKKMETSLLLQKALSEKDYKKAVFYADKFILLSEISGEDKLPFDRELAEEVLIDINRVLRDAGLQPFLMSGTLLGFIREGRILEHDKDFDIGIMGWEAQFDIANALLKSDKYTIKTEDLTGEGIGMLAVKHRQSAFGFDIFFFYDKGDHFIHSIDSRANYTFSFKNSKFNLIEHQFLGETFYIPNEYERLLAEHYGFDWKIPNPNYFVTLESPALLKKNGLIYAFSVRHEMLKLMTNNATLEKAKALKLCIEKNVNKKEQPKESVMRHFIESFEHLESSADNNNIDNLL